jgi:hypothetical protein
MITGPETVYESIRRDIPSGAILLAQGRSIWSRLIRRFTGEWSHCGLLIWKGKPPTGRLMLIEAVDQGVQEVYFSNWLRRAKKKGTVAAYGVHPHVNETNIHAIEDKAERLCGEAYDYLRLPIIGADILIDLKNESDQLPPMNGKLICSRVVYEALLAGGIWLTTKGGWISPVDIANQIEVRERLL